jgi:ketosteroid isomerase-like protein
MPPGLLELRRSVNAWIDAFGRGDADALAALFTEDSMLFPSGASPVDGRVAVRDYFADRFASRTGAIELEQVEVGVEGALGYKRGRWREVSDDGAVAATGSFLEVWKRVGDRWLLHRGMWTPDAF